MVQRLARAMKTLIRCGVWTQQRTKSIYIYIYLHERRTSDASDLRKKDGQILEKHMAGNSQGTKQHFLKQCQQAKPDQLAWHNCI